MFDQQSDVAAALVRVRATLQRRPASGLHDDAPATACWQGGCLVTARHANGTEVASDMPAELGGGGALVTPGWLFRAGLASCATTSIVLTAASEGVVLTTLEVRACSRSDTRGLLGMSEADGRPVSGGPSELRLQVRICAPGVAPQRLRALVAQGLRCSPVPSAVQQATALAVQIDIDPS